MSQTSVMKRLFSMLSLLAGLCCGAAVAQPLADVRLQFGDNGVVATIQMTSPVQYLRHFPERNGKTVEIFYDRAPGAVPDKKLVDEKWVDGEVLSSPPSSLIPSFTVTTRDQQTQPRLVIEFSREANYSVAPGKDGRSLLLTIRPDRTQVSARSALPMLPVIRPEAIPAADADVAVIETGKQARELMVNGRDALANAKNEEAVGAFNQLLMLPPNDYTQDAQEWVGVARERAGQTDKAKFEYELYLKLYTTGEGVGWVKQRLAGLSGKAAAPAVKIDGAPDKPQAARWVTFGGITSRYYWGSSQYDSTYIFNDVSNTTSYSATDQSMLITNVDVTERYISEEYDNRLVFRDVATKNFITTQTSSNRINYAYAEVKNRTRDYTVRLGRQSSSGAGVMGRFDGVSGGYGPAENWRVNATVGKLTDFTQSSSPVFTGASLDKGPFSVFFVNQRLEGSLDRRAVGGEFRYYEPNKSAYALLDYDTYFSTLNTAMFMGTLGNGKGTTLNFMADRRKTPTLSIRNALNGAGTSSIDVLRQALSESQLIDLAKARTATSNFYQIGVTQPLTEKWQAGSDLKFSDVSGMSASGTTTLEGVLPATAGTGVERTLTGQVIGNSLFMDRDILSVNVSLVKSSARTGSSLYLYYQRMIGDKWSVDGSWMTYVQNDDVGGELLRNSPMLRTSYRIGDRLSVDADIGVDLTNTSGSLSSSRATRTYLSTGLRWDF